MSEPAPPSSGRQNVDERTVIGFGDEWKAFDQSSVDDSELAELFARYFAIFPWELLGEGAQGFDMGCGSGRWAKLVASRVAHLTCIDASAEALEVAKRNLDGFSNVQFLHASANATPLPDGSQSFGYSLGVLHHVPDTASALAACTRLLRRGAPFLLYLYYRFDNRPAWYRYTWQASDVLRRVVSRLPPRSRMLVTDLIACLVYLPLARLAAALEKMGVPAGNVPLYEYRHLSFYTMRTDSRDRFGTALEQRFTRREVEKMMLGAGLTDIRFSENAPYWCAVGIKQ